MDHKLSCAARWLKDQPWKGDPEHWVGQAMTRYQLTEAQVALLLYSMISAARIH